MQPGPTSSSSIPETDSAQMEQENQQRARELIKKATSATNERERHMLIRQALEFEIQAQTLKDNQQRLFPDLPIHSESCGVDDTVEATSKNLHHKSVWNESSGSSEDIKVAIDSGQVAESTDIPEARPAKSSQDETSAADLLIESNAQLDRPATSMEAGQTTDDEFGSDTESPLVTGEVEIVDTLEVTVKSTGTNAPETTRRKPRKLEMKGKKKPRKIEVRSHG